MSFPPPTPKQARVLWFSLSALAVAVLLGLLGLLLWGLGWLAVRLSAVLLPMALALVLAYILDPVVEFFTRKKIPRVWAIALVFLLALMVVGGILGSVIPGVVKESRKLVEDLPANTRIFRLKLEDFMQNSRIAHLLPANWHWSSLKLLSSKPPATPAATNNPADTNLPVTIPGQTNDVTPITTNPPPVTATANPTGTPPEEQPADIVMNGLGQALVTIAKWITAQLSKVTTWMEFLIGFVLVPIYLFYFLLEKQRINRGWTDYLPLHESKTKDELAFVLGAINDCMIVFFRGQVLVALCVGTLLAIGYLILGLNYAVLLGIVAAVLGIVPYLGTITSLVLALTVAGIQFGDWTHPLCVIGIAAVVKLLEDLIISPKIIGNRSGLHPLIVILAVMIGANLLGGFLGALLAVPLAAALRTLMFRYIWKRDPDTKPSSRRAGKAAT